MEKELKESQPKNVAINRRQLVYWKSRSKALDSGIEFLLFLHNSFYQLLSEGEGFLRELLLPSQSFQDHRWVMPRKVTLVERL